MLTPSVVDNEVDTFWCFSGQLERMMSIHANWSTGNFIM